MPISVTCECGKSMRVKDEWAGRRARCPGCQSALTVPDLSKPRRKNIEADDEEIVDAIPVHEDTGSSRMTKAKPPTKRRPDYDDEDDKDDRPRRRRRDEEDDEDDRPSSRRSRPDRDRDLDRDRYDEEDADEDDRPRSKRSRQGGGRVDDDRPIRRKKKPAASSGGGGFGTTTAGLWGGLAMMVLAIVWFVLGLYGGRIFFYPPILFVLGLIAFIKGCMGE